MGCRGAERPLRRVMALKSSMAWSSASSSKEKYSGVPSIRGMGPSCNKKSIRGATFCCRIVVYCIRRCANAAAAGGKRSAEEFIDFIVVVVGDIRGGGGGGCASVEGLSQ